MNTFFSMIIPCLFLFSILYASIKKIPIYDSFTSGAKKAIPLIVSIFPYIAAVSILCELLEVSGLQALLLSYLSPVCAWLGIPKEIVPLLFIKPLSGSGSIAVLTQILQTHGVDSYIALCACVVYGACDTIFYIGAVYFAGLKRKKLSLAMGIALFSFLVSAVVACVICRFV